MQVSYRGISYETTATVVEGTETEQIGLFLGNRFKVKQYSTPHNTAAPMQLKYRGINYQQ
jgi:hypothetical protein